MNERIKELAKQAGAAYGDGYDFYLLEDHIEKFAELIVGECGDVAYNAYWENPETVRGIHIKEKIKQHFGVEE